MVTSNSIEIQQQNRSHQFFPTEISEKVRKFHAIYFNIKNVIQVQSRRGQNPPHTPLRSR